MVPSKWRIFRGDRRSRVLLTVAILVFGYLATVVIGVGL